MWGRQEQHRRTHWGGCASVWNVHSLESQSTDRLEGISLKSNYVAISKSQQPVLEPERSQRAARNGRIAGLNTQRTERKSYQTAAEMGRLCRWGISQMRKPRGRTLGPHGRRPAGEARRSG